MTPEQALIAAYRRAAKRLRVQILQDLQSGRIGTATYRQGQLAAVRRELTRLGATSRALAPSVAIREYLRGVVLVEHASPPALLTARFTGVHRHAAEVLAGNLTRKLEDAVQLVGRRTEDAYRAVGLDETLQGVVSGSTRKEVSAAIQDRLIRDKVTDAVTGHVDRGGRRWALDTYSDMVARTTTREAVTQGTANRMGETGQDLVTISSHGTTCDICREFEGNTYSISGLHPDYDVLPEWPPFHPNCEHHATPGTGDLDTDFDALEREFNDPERVRFHVNRVLGAGLIPA